MRMLKIFTFLSFIIFSISCQGGGDAPGIGSSGAVNPKEKLEYKRALLNCYKSGGSRIVKIKSQLRCF